MFPETLTAIVLYCNSMNNTTELRQSCIVETVVEVSHRAPEYYRELINAHNWYVSDTDNLSDAKAAEELAMTDVLNERSMK